MSDVLLIVSAAAWLWCVLALRYMQSIPIVVRSLLVAACAVQPFVTASVWGRMTALVVTPIVVLPVASAWRRRMVPSLHLDWADDQARLPFASFDGDRVTITNVRNATYRATNDYEVSWETRSYDIAAVCSLDYVVEPFGFFHGMAHTFLSFGFADGRHVAISVEVRRERPEIFGPLKGLFRQYELMYVVGDERDIIGMRANVRRDKVFVYPIRTTRDHIRAIFESMLRRANKLAREPEFYNTLGNNCATNILDHVNELVDESWPYSLRVAVPGFSVRYAYDRGLIATDLPFALAKKKFRINERSAFLPDADDEGRSWSRQIRDTGDAP